MSGRTHHQRGNALFLILIAVALFAALSYAITQSGRGGAGSISKEKQIIDAAQIAQDLAALKVAAVRMVMAGTPATSLKLHLPADSSEPCTDTDGTCLFHPSGGGANWPAYPDTAFNQPLIEAINMPSLNLGKVKGVEASDTCAGPASQCGAAIVGVGTSLPEVGVGLAPITESLCAALNKGLGITSIPVQDPTEFGASFADGYTTFSALPGTETFCADISEAAIGTAGAGFYVYNQTFIAR